NEAAAALALMDLRKDREWVGMTESNVAFDPDFRHYARCNQAGGVSVRRVADDAEVFRLEGLGVVDRDAYHPEFSPDGGHLSVGQQLGGRIKVWRLAGGRRHLLDELGPGHSMPALAPDGRFLLCAGADGAIEILSLPAGERRQLPAADGARGFPAADI